MNKLTLLPLLFLPIFGATTQESPYTEIIHEKTELLVGGRIRQDTLYTSYASGDLSNDLRLFGNSIPAITDTGDRHQLRFSARDSRVWFKTKTLTEYGPLRTLMEFDLWGNDGNEKTSNSHNIRLRHAYFTLGHITFGQTNSTFLSSNAADSVSFTLGDIFMRQPQFRYTFPIDEGNIAFGIEQPESTLTKSDGTLINPGDDRLPDLVIKAKWFGRWGLFSLSTLFRQIRIDDVAGADQEFASAVRIAGMIKTSRLNNIRLTIAGGNGFGRYIGYNSFTTAYLDANNQITLTPIYTAQASYQHYLANTTRLNLIFAYVGSTLNSSYPDTSHAKEYTSTHLNIRHSVFKNAMISLEYIYATKLSIVNDFTNLHRLIFSTSYDF